MEFVLTSLGVVIKVIGYFLLLGTALGIVDGLRKVNRHQYYAYLVKYYQSYTRSRLSFVIPVLFRYLIVSGIDAACGREAASAMIVVYCIEAALVMTIGQRSRRSAHG